MSVSYNKFYDLYIKTKGSSGAITGGYTFQVDGASNLNGNLNVVGTINTVSSTIFNYIANLTSDAQAQLTSLSSSISTINTTLTGISYSGATLMQTIIPNINSTKYFLSGVQLSNIGNTQFLDISSSLTSQLTSVNSNITNLQILLTGASYNSSYNYLNFTNNIHIYGSLLLAGLSTDVNSTFTDVYSKISTINTTLNGISYSSSTLETTIPNINSTKYYLSGVQLSNIGNTQYLDINSSLTSQLAGKTTLSAIQSNANVWTSTNSYNVSLPTSTLTPSSSSQLITKAYADTTYATITNLSSANSSISALQTILTGASWDSTYYFLNLSNNLHVYGSLQVAGLSNDLATTISNIYSILSSLTTLSAIQSNNNSWTGNNAFNTSLPTSSLTPSSSTQLITKAYADANYTASGATTLSAIQSNNNSWTGNNAFNTSLPTSSLTPSSSSQLITKAYCDSQVGTKQNTLTSSSNLSIGTLSCTSLSCTSETDSGSLTCSNITSPSTSNLVLNAPSGQTINFDINNVVCMQLYNNGVVQIGSDQIFNKLLVLFDGGVSDTPSTATNYYGFGINSHVLRYQVDTTSSSHKFYGSTTNYATIDNTGVNINNGNLSLSTSQPSSGSQLGYNNYTSTSGTTNYTCTTSLQAYSSAASVTLPNAGVYNIFCCNIIKPSSSLTNASFLMEINTYTLSSCYQFYSSLPSGTYITLNTNPITISVTASTTLTLYFTTQCSSGSANLQNNFNMQYVRIG